MVDSIVVFLTLSMRVLKGEDVGHKRLKSPETLERESVLSLGIVIGRVL